ncbi:MAG: zinc ribbon domain-containing protein [Dehalococcoidales bacterium]|nr:zinc ribbon domain-containing protein [Dehalococcoidales bacterium]
MPIYEYECNLCQFRFEKRQGFDEAAIAICPRCQGKVVRVLHPVPAIFKGSGFYVTDSRPKTNEAKPGKDVPKVT